MVCFTRADRCPEENQLKRGSAIESAATDALPLGVTANLLDLLEQPILVFDRTGRILLANLRGKTKLSEYGFSSEVNLNLYSDLLRVHPRLILDRIDAGDQKIDSKFECCSGGAMARIQWLPEADWLVVRIEDIEKPKLVELSAITKHTVQELLQEREITY